MKELKEPLSSFVSREAYRMNIGDTLEHEQDKEGYSVFRVRDCLGNIKSEWSESTGSSIQSLK